MRTASRQRDEFAQSPPNLQEKKESPNLQGRKRSPDLRSPGRDDLSLQRRC